MEYKTTSTELTTIANAIRTKGGTSQPLEYPTEFVSAIQNIPSGGSVQSKSKTYTPTESRQTETVTPDNGYIGLSSVNITVDAIQTETKSVTPTEMAQTITPSSGKYLTEVEVGAIDSNYVGSGVPIRQMLSQTGNTVYANSGYYPSNISKVLAAGTEGTPAATKGTVVNNSVEVTPEVTNSEGWINGGTHTGTAVTVSADELVSGTLQATANGRYNATNYQYVNVDIAGADTFYTGTFTTGSSAGVGSVRINYVGSGYPIMCVVVVEEGAYNSGSTWYDSLQRYAVGQWTMTKSNFLIEPTYSTSGVANQGVTTWVYKNSTSSSTTYSRSSAMNTNAYSSSNASNAGATCVRFTSKTQLSYYVNTSSYGLHPSTTYRYFVYYNK